ncbi:non-ribosomal peptide synthetase [Saccharothrix obliqua]|uniref:non-ribosomal peptide synthetase n=1 Tax=Saccharothrix obliqua TaxID=2861747 RepID=UPI001C5F5326|nr:amino acid adenylation domain-containing protein [Saccharothrix obliqua]MBW4718333.1 amino acid adenylation domain-containing protein [Saccharothrix obliqua]
MSGHWPLAPNQAELYVADQTADHVTAYHSASVHAVPPDLDPAEPARRLAALAAAHPLLAARVTADGCWAPARPPVLHVRDAPDRSAIRQECARPFAPHRGPLLRAVLLRYPDGAADLVLVAHHLVTDERSTELMARWLLAGERPEPAETYRRWTERLAPPDPDRVAAVRERLRAADLDLPLDWGQGVPGGPGDRADLRVPAPTWRGVRRSAAALGVTPHSAVLGAAALVLARWTGAANPVLGTNVSRRSARHADTIGYFGATVAVPVAVDEDQSLGDFLRAAHDRCLAAYRTADIPLSAVTDHAPRCVVVPRTGRTDVDLGAAQFPLTLYLGEEPDGGAHALLRFQTSVVGRPAAERFLRCLDVVLAAFADDPGTPTHAVPTMARADMDAVLASGRGAHRDAPDTTITELFAARVAAGPDRVAVTAGDTSLTYAELDDRSTGLARALVDAGVEPGTRVGVRLERGPDLVVALLAVLKAGAAYVPLDPDYPAERTAFVTADSGLRVVVGDVPDATSVPPSARGSAELSRPAAGDAAYVIYTSGSTGRPKGVVVPHRNVAALLAAADGFGLGPDDVWTLFHSFAFDFSVWEVWGCLLTGGRLVVVPHWTARDPDEFHALLARERVTVLNQTPSAFAQLDPGDDLSVRLLVFGGEALDARLVLPWLDAYPRRRCRVVNMYGITETTVHCTWHDVTRADALAGPAPVGRPLPGWELHVRDPRGRLVPPGVAGEIHVGGLGVALGYLHRPELTAERFAGGRYRSGDRGRYLDDGRLLHLGRLDDQVKVRGHRIEPGEIRFALLADPRVTAAAVVVRRSADSAAVRLDAYAVTSAPAPDLRARLVERLPAHLVPATVTEVGALPLTANGKLDVARLPAPGPVVAETAAPVPEDGVEARVRAIWERLMGVPVGPDDNFFELGGNSLLAVRLNAALRESGFATVRLRDIFRHSTVRRLARVLRGSAS